MESAIVAVAVIAYLAFLQYLRHHRRILLYRERAAAIEKGVELPALEQEVKRNNWNVQRLLLLCGLVWITLGIAAFTVLSVILKHPPIDATKDIPQGIQYVAIAPLGIGLAHLITFWAGERRGPQT